MKALQAQRIDAEIIFDQVDFKFEGMQKYLLKHISFHIKKGSFVGICGERGAGTPFSCLLTSERSLLQGRAPSSS